MALARHGSRSTALGNHFGNGENTDAMIGKAGQGKTRGTSAMARSVLGNISNKTGNTKLEQSKVLKENQKPGRITRSSATTNLKSVTDKENATSKLRDLKFKEAKQEAKVEYDLQAPTVMDISANSEGGCAYSKEQLLNVNDIDSDDKGNPQLVSQYVNEIYDYLKDVEKTLCVRAHYMKGMQINGRMRSILIDWLVQVHLRFHLLQETLYLTVGIIDRFLQEKEVSKTKLQLVGVTSMLIASKYEEMYAPEIADFVYITDNAYTKSDIRKMECLILQTLDFNLGRPLALHFLRRNSKAGEVDATKHTLAKYLVELTIVDYDLVHAPPSQIAAAALCLAMKILDNSEWSDTLAHYSKYTEKELTSMMQRMALLVTKAGSGKFTAIQTKYQSSKFMKICTIPELSGQVVKDLVQGLKEDRENRQEA